MTIDREKLRALTTFTLTRLSEDEHPKDHFEDVDVITDVLEQYAGGNDWAWFCARVRASYAGIEGVDYLGCCSYASEEEFLVDAYYPQLCNDAFDELVKELEALESALQLVTVADVPTHS